MIALLLVACVHRQPAPLFPTPPPSPELPEPRRVDAPPGACRGELVDPGAPLACTGIAISVQASEYVELVEADLALARRLLAVGRDGRLQDRAFAEAEARRLGTALREAEREARLHRAVAPAAFVGGVALGVGVALAVARLP